MTLVDRSPTTQEPELRPQQPDLGRRDGSTVAGRLALGLVGVGAAVAVAMGVANSHQSDALQSQVDSLHGALATTQDQLAAARTGLGTMAGLPTSRDLAADQATMLTGKAAASHAQVGLSVGFQRSAADLVRERSALLAGKVAAARAGTDLPSTTAPTGTDPATEHRFMVAGKVAASQWRASHPVSR